MISVEVWKDGTADIYRRNNRNPYESVMVAEAPSLIDALIAAEKELRADLDEVQRLLHAEREQQKVGK